VVAGDECDESVLGAIVTSPLTGTISGNAIAFSFAATIEDPFRADFTGTVLNGRMGGTLVVVFADPADDPEHGTWTIVRQ
jgi:hypothetical protein